MMWKKGILILTLFCKTAFGQFAVIENNDGFVTVRSSGRVTSKITDTLINGQAVFCFKLESSWYPVDYESGGLDKSGYIHQSGLKLVTDFPKIPREALTKNRIFFRKDTLTLLMTTTDFAPSRNSLQYHAGDAKKNEAAYLEKINGQKIWGADGNVPQKEYSRILLKLGNKKIELPAENLFEPNLEFTTASIDTQNETIYISAANGDGAGAYAVLWIIKKGRVAKRLAIIPF